MRREFAKALIGGIALAVGLWAWLDHHPPRYAWAAMTTARARRQRWAAAESGGVHAGITFSEEPRSLSIPPL